MSEMEDVVKEFLVESEENLDRVDRELVELEKNPSNRELLASIFRTVHTIKGLAGFLGFPHLESLTHTGESLLSKLRDGELPLTVDRANVLLAMVDAIRKIMVQIQSNSSEGDEEYLPLIESLNAQRTERGGEGRLEGTATAAETSLFEKLGGAAALETVVNRFYERIFLDPDLKTFFEKIPLDTIKKHQVRFLSRIFGASDGPEGRGMKEVHKHMKITPSHFRTFGRNLEETLQAMGVGEDLIQEALSRVNVLVSDIVTDFPKTSADTAEKNQEKPENHLTPFSDTSIRVDVGLLDKLMNQVGELVLVRNQVLQFTTALKDAAFLGASQRLNLITTELQEGVMKTRMQPIDNVWNKFPRVIRDLAQSCGKKARLEMRGKETELDRTIIEAIKDPLTHLARNAVDHGIETPGERAAAGKAIEGCITLHAYHEGGQVIIEITDDGGGMDAEKIKQRALQGGYITPEQAGRLSEREIQHLIFLPGFTTNDQVTHVSGRGVGMDVVKTNIERIGGTVDIQSKKGEGTTIKMRIPLTLAIIPALIVASGGRRYAIPQISLVELVRLEADDPDQKVEYIHNAPVYRLRGKLLPLVYLNRELKGALRVNEGEEAVNIVVLQADDQQFGLVVEIINDTEEIVVKPLGKQLKSVSIFAGATIMGDGFVALILDVMGLAQRAHVVTENQESGIGTREDLTLKDADEGDKNRQTLLLFGVGKDGRGAIPLSAVSRLEVFPKTSLEKSGNQLVIQHRNEILPLIHLSGFLQDSAAAEWSELLQVVVHTAGERKVGFVVDQILDIVEGSVGLQQLSGRDGVMGTAVVLDRVTDLVDVGRVLHLTGFNGNGFSKSKTEV